MPWGTIEKVFIQVDITNLDALEKTFERLEKIREGFYEQRYKEIESEYQQRHEVEK